jgi:hypothetical protein
LRFKVGSDVGSIEVSSKTSIHLHRINLKPQKRPKKISATLEKGEQEFSSKKVFVYLNSDSNLVELSRENKRKSNS